LWHQLIHIRQWWDLALKLSTWWHVCEKIRNMELSDCLKYFPTKTGVLVDWKQMQFLLGYIEQQYLCCQFFCSAQKLTTQVLLFDVSGSGWPRVAVSAQYVCCHFYQCFQSTKTPVFVRKHFKQSLRSIFLIFSQRFEQVAYLSSVLIPI